MFIFLVTIHVLEIPISSTLKYIGTNSAPGKLQRWDNFGGDGRKWRTVLLAMGQCNGVISSKPFSHRNYQRQVWGIAGGFGD